MAPLTLKEDPCKKHHMKLLLYKDLYMTGSFQNGGLKN